MNDSTGRRQVQFLANLTQAMRSTAEAARQTTLDTCRNEAEAYIARLRSGTGDGTAGVRREAEADIALIRDQSKGQLEKLRAETERQVIARRDSLVSDLAGLNAALEQQVSRVDARVEAYEAQVAQFFGRLLEGADAADFARMASEMPEIPRFTDED